MLFNYSSGLIFGHCSFNPTYFTRPCNSPISTKASSIQQVLLHSSNALDNDH